MSFTFKFTKEKLAACLPHNKDVTVLFQAMTDILPRYEINTVERVAAFLAQCGHESVDFTVMRENLNYSTKGLMSTWPKRFPNEAAAAPYNRNPEKIANKVYADRMGNGPESSGEGYRYRGRGYIQLTGKSNYQAFATSVNRELAEVIGYLETSPGALESACWFWKKNNLNGLADKQDMKAATKVINGGDLGLAERTDHFKNNLVKLSA
jgi:putative chitinase